jgi:hypothetical protein
MCSSSCCQKLSALSYVQAAAWLFSCSFSINFLYFPFYVYVFLVFFVGYYLSAMMLFDLEEEIFVDGGRPPTALSSYLQYFPYNNHLMVVVPFPAWDSLLISFPFLTTSYNFWKGLACLWFLWDHK